MEKQEKEIFKAGLLDANDGTEIKSAAAILEIEDEDLACDD